MPNDGLTLTLVSFKPNHNIDFNGNFLMYLVNTINTTLANTNAVLEPLLNLVGKISF